VISSVTCRVRAAREDERRGDVQVEVGLGREDARGPEGGLERGDLELDPQPDPGGRGEDEVGPGAIGKAAEGLVADDRAGVELHDRLEERNEDTGIEDRLDVRPLVVITLAGLDPGGKQCPEDRGNRHQHRQLLARLVR
jgi:hypothetical protein